jgi:hypothetical protein
MHTATFTPTAYPITLVRNPELGDRMFELSGVDLGGEFGEHRDVATGAVFAE